MGGVGDMRQGARTHMHAHTHSLMCAGKENRARACKPLHVRPRTTRQLPLPLQLPPPARGTPAIHLWYRSMRLAPATVSGDLAAMPRAAAIAPSTSAAWSGNVADTSPMRCASAPRMVRPVRARSRAWPAGGGGGPMSSRAPVFYRVWCRNHAPLG